MTRTSSRPSDLDWRMILKRTTWESLLNPLRLHERVFANLTVILAILWVPFGRAFVFPYNNLLSCVLLIDVCLILSRRGSLDLALALFACAWLTTAVDVAWSYNSCFMVHSAGPGTLPPNLFEDLIWSIRMGLAAPAFFAIPAVYFVLREFDQIVRSPRRWLVLAPIIALVDVFVLLVGIMLVFR
jgi:hypothetical protein